MVKRNIVDMMSNIDEREIKTLEIADKEIEELTKDIRFESITLKAMEEIRKESKPVKTMPIKRKLKKVWMVAAAVLVLGGSVFAAQYLDNFKFFYGDNVNLSPEDKTIINKTQTASGVKMTVEEGVIGGNSAIIMVTFEKGDGTHFPKDARVRTLELNSDKMASYMVNQQVTEDGLKLIGSFEMDTLSTLDGQKITVQADTIIDTSTQKVITAGPWKSTFKADAAKGLKGMAIDLEISHPGEILMLKQLNVSALGIEIQGTRMDEHKDKLPDYTPVVKITTTEGKVIELKSGSTSTTDIGFKWQYNLDANNNIIFINNQSVKSITIDGKTIDINP